MASECQNHLAIAIFLTSLIRIEKEQQIMGVPSKNKENFTNVLGLLLTQRSLNSNKVSEETLKILGDDNCQF